MKRYMKILTGLLILAALFFACSEKTIDSIYTNPDAIVDVMQLDDAASEAHNIDFIEYDVFHSLGAPLEGDFGATSYKLSIDSVSIIYDIDVGDTVYVSNLWAKEADAQTQYKIYYSLTLKNDDGDEVVKHITTNPNYAHKSSYYLQLGDFNSAQRGWRFWGVSNLFKLSVQTPQLVWRSEEKGALTVNDQIILKQEFESLSSGDRITVQYKGAPDDIVYLTTNENTSYRHEKFQKVTDSLQEAKWTISSSPSGKDYYYYAGIEVYRYETLADADTTEKNAIFLGMMYSIEE